MIKDMKKRRSIMNVVRCVLAVALLIISTLPSSPALACDNQFLSSNNIYYYNCNTNACTSAAPSYTTRLDLPTLTGKDKEEKIWNFLISPAQGLSPEQAAGVMGNIQKESGFDPTKVETDAANAGKGYGIVQWTGSRRTALEDAAKQQGVPVSDLAFQLSFMVQESNSREVTSAVADMGLGRAGANEWDTLKQQKTVENAALFWHYDFEQSSDPRQTVEDTRVQPAKAIYANYGGKSAPTVASAVPTPNPSGDAGSGCSQFAGGNLVQTLMAYAWPQYHAGDYLEMRPAYATAVQKANSEGRNVGGGIHPGIDCAGFVNTLIIDSGFEPTFNNTGKGDGQGTGEQQERDWMMQHWKKIGTGGSINVADLRPGDVAVTYPGSTVITHHTFIYVGQINGFGNQFASASYGEYDGSGYWRTPMAAGSYENATSTDFEWYGKR